MVERKDIWFAVVNPHAGSGKTISEWQKAEIRLRQMRIHYTSAKSEHINHAVELTADAAAKGYRKFVAVGGDGTVHDVLNGIMKYYDMTEGVALSEFTLAVIPIGSGNDWIKSHGVPNDTLEAVNLIAAGRFSLQDVVRIKQFPYDGSEDSPSRVDYMLNIAGIGFDARVCERVNVKKQMGKSGRFIYFLSLLRVLRHFYSFQARVIADDKTIYEGDCYSLAFGTGPYSGGGMRQVPEAIVNDGLTDVLVIPKVKMTYLFRHLHKLFTGTLLSVPELVYAQAKVIKVLPTEAFGDIEPIEVDGEVVGRYPVVFEVIEEQLNVLSNKN